MYQDEPETIEPEFQRRYKLGQRGLRPYPLRDMRKFNVNRFGQHIPRRRADAAWERRKQRLGQAPELSPVREQDLTPRDREVMDLFGVNTESPIPPWVLWLAIGLLIWLLFKK